MVLKISRVSGENVKIFAGWFLSLMWASFQCQSQEPLAEQILAADIDLSSEKRVLNPINPIILENALLKPFGTIQVASPVEGRIARLTIKEGDWVSEKQFLGCVEDQAIQLQLERARIATSMASLKLSSQVESQLAIAKSEVAKNELDRAVAANARVADTYPLKEVDRLKLVYDSAKLEVERASEEKIIQRLELRKFENEQAMSEELLARYQIVSPVSGMVVSVSRHAGEWVQPGSEVLQIVQLDRLRVEGFITIMEQNNLAHRRAVVEIVREEKELQIAGKVLYVYPEINSLTNQMRVVLEVENPQNQLVPGSRVKASILPENQP